jgi:hypothetical protein
MLFDDSTSSDSTSDDPTSDSAIQLSSEDSVSSSELLDTSQVKPTLPVFCDIAIDVANGFDSTYRLCGLLLLLMTSRASSTT